MIGRSGLPERQSSHCSPDCAHGLNWVPAHCQSCLPNGIYLVSEFGPSNKSWPLRRGYEVYLLLVESFNGPFFLLTLSAVLVRR